MIKLGYGILLCRKGRISLKENILKQLNEYTSLLNVYRCFPTIEKKDMITILDLSLPTLNKVLSVLKEHDFLIFDEENKINVINQEFGYYVGISVGSTQIKVVILNFAFEPLNNGNFNNVMQKCDIFSTDNSYGFKQEKDDNGYGYFYSSTSKKELSELIDQINYIFEQVVILNEYLLVENQGVLGIGLSFSGSVDIKNKIIESVPNIKYIRSLNYECLIGQKYREYLIENNIPISIDHNAKTTAIAEKYYLYRNNTSFSENENMAVLYMGFGISSGIVLNSRLYRGIKNSSGEIGHVPILYKMSEDESECCGCGSKNCLEFRIRKDVFGYTEDNFKEATTKELIDILNNNEEKIELFVEYIGYAINYLVNILNIELIIFSGKLSSIYNGVPKFNKYFMNNIENYGIEYTRQNCKFSFSRLGLLSSAIGAAIESAYPDYEEIVWPVLRQR